MAACGRAGSYACEEQAEIFFLAALRNRRATRAAPGDALLFRTEADRSVSENGRRFQSRRTNLKSCHYDRLTSPGGL
jgi:hypothetical protein